MRSRMQKGLVLALVSSMCVLGCELIVDFDRTKIVGEEVPETGAPDTSIPATDATTDTGADAQDPDAGNDAADDAADAAADG